MRARRGAKYVAFVLMMALMVPGVFLVAGAIQQDQEAGKDLDAKREKACATVPDRVVASLSGFADDFRGLSATSDQRVPPMPSMEHLRAEAQDLRSELSTAGCRLGPTEREVRSWRGRTGRDGDLAAAVRSAIAANVLDVLDGTSAPVRRTVRPGEDVAEVAATVPAGATLVLPAGRFETARTLVVVQDLTIEGAGARRTTVESSAEGAALLLASPVALRVTGIRLAHVGARPASVVVLRAGRARLERVEVSGATARTADGRGREGASLAAGSGVVLAGARTVEVVGSTLAGNAVAGLLAAGRAAPTVRGSHLDRNRVCGACFVGHAAGVVTGSTFAGNGVGVMLADRSRPRLHDNTVRDSRYSGVLAEGRSRPRITDSSLRGNRTGALVFTGHSGGRAAGNTCAGGRFQVVLDASASPRLRDNGCRVHDQRR